MQNMTKRIGEALLREPDSLAAVQVSFVNFSPDGY